MTDRQYKSIFRNKVQARYNPRIKTKWKPAESLYERLRGLKRVVEVTGLEPTASTTPTVISTSDLVGLHRFMRWMFEALRLNRTKPNTMENRFWKISGNLEEVCLNIYLVRLINSSRLAAEICRQFFYYHRLFYQCDYNWKERKYMIQ